ncbi:MAG: CBS domain-containing protein [Clostridiales bacterium]|nr:MAG: CBS domain-containing protein [Clostridiales bacterium]
MKVKDLMSRRLFALPDSATAEAAARLMSKENIGLLPVLSKGRLAGVVTDRDIMTRCVAAARAPGETALCEIMTRKVVYSRPEETVMEASRQMARHRVRRLPVCRGDTVVGVLSLGDLARREDTSFEAAMAICEISLPNDASSG